MEGDQNYFQQRLKDEIRKTLPKLAEDVALALAESIHKDGIESQEDLHLIDIDYLLKFMRLFEAKKLIDVWATRGKEQERPAQSIQAPVVLVPPTAPSTSALPILWHSSYRVKWHKLPDSILSVINQKKTLSNTQVDEVVDIVVKDIMASVPGVNRSFMKAIAQDMILEKPGSFSNIEIKQKKEKENDANDPNELNNENKQTGTLNGEGNLKINTERLIYKLKNKLDNLKRRDKTKLQLEAPAIPAAYGCIRWRVLEMPEDETEESLQQKVDTLKEMYDNCVRKNWNWEVITENMKDTYIFQRRDINSQQTPASRRKRKTTEEEDVDSPSVITTDQIGENYPFLFEPKGILVHFNLLTGKAFDVLLDAWLSNESVMFIDFLAKDSEKNMSLRRAMQRAKQHKTCHETDGEAIAIMLMLITKLKEDKGINSFMKLVEVGTKYHEIKSFTDIPGPPCMFGVGESSFKCKKFYVSIDGEVRCPTRTFKDALTVAFCSYFVFNMCYPLEIAKTMDFIQRSIAQINPPTGSKVPRKQRGSNVVPFPLSTFMSDYNAFKDQILKENC